MRFIREGLPAIGWAAKERKDDGMKFLTTKYTKYTKNSLVSPFVYLVYFVVKKSPFSFFPVIRLSLGSLRSFAAKSNAAFGFNQTQTIPGMGRILASPPDANRVERRLPVGFACPCCQNGTQAFRPRPKLQRFKPVGDRRSQGQCADAPAGIRPSVYSSQNWKNGLNFPAAKLCGFGRGAVAVNML
jgi:hypothetical protein